VNTGAFPAFLQDRREGASGFVMQAGRAGHQPQDCQSARARGVADAIARADEVIE